MKSKYVHFLVSGRVQGVGFRIFTQQTAKNFNLLGWVRNLNDGRVEGIASGEESNINSFSDALKAGPDFSKVTDLCIVEISMNDFATEKEFTTFTIAKDSVTTWTRN